MNQNTPPTQAALPPEVRARLRAQTLLVTLALVTIAAISWWFLFETERAMVDMRGDGFFIEFMWMMMTPAEVREYLPATAIMWVVMMIAMMVPAVMPMLTVFRRLDRGRPGDIDTFLFAIGYLTAWSIFSIVAAGLQWQLHANGFLAGNLLAAKPALAAATLFMAGVYQLTPAKEACLQKCRSPMGFFLAHMRHGAWGAVVMGLHHGLYCIGCCWMLMMLMFVGGAMSVVTMALLSFFILAERILPAGPWVSRLPGAFLIVWGILLLWGG